MASSNLSQQFFQGARKLTIAERPGLKRLLDNIAPGAFHDAAERGDQPGCHPKTRIAIRAEIMEWIKAPPAMRKLILWMYGPAGSGKTAIAQSIAEECARLGGLAASFFFWRTAPGRDDASRFVATIAYQLSRYIPQMEEHLLTAIERDPMIFYLSLSTQMRVLVIDPLKRAAPSLSTPVFAIVDGIDECGPNGQSQAELVHLLGSIALEFQHLPMIFLIASRPEYKIRKAFNNNLLKPLAKVLVLDNNYKPDEDIKAYFDSTFRAIYQEHCDLGRHFPSPWPTAVNVHSLVSKASGQFIFAATVTRFIDSPRHNPADRMNIILRLSTSGNDTPFTLIDQLYRVILDSVADIEMVLHILAFLLLDTSINFLNQAEELLDIEFRSTLLDMHSLVCVPPPSDTNAKLPTVYHASFEDFLMDQSRSRQYYIGKNEGHLLLSRYWLKAIGGFPHFKNLMLHDMVRHFGYHAKESSGNEDIANDLAQFDLRAVLKEISDFKNDLYNTDWVGFLDDSKNLVGSNRLDIFLRLQNDFDVFLLDHIALYPPSLRTHIPALLCLLCCGDGPRIGDLFRILLLRASNSAREHTEFLNLDNMLLIDNDSKAFYRFKYQIWESLFRDKSRAGEYFVDGKSYVALAKAIVSVVYSRPGERDHQIRLARNGRQLYAMREGWDPTMRISISDCARFDVINEVLENASTDWDLANYLRERAVQYRDDVQPIPGRMNIANACIKYIQRCGVPFL
ncbi:hypothetical protein BJ912DRAFT_1144082, partial [Pholiota molesta]